MLKSPIYRTDKDSTTEKMNFYGYILIFLRLFITVTAINHWLLKDNQIIPKPESPFLMRDPTNLPTFLTQIQDVGNVENSFIQLLGHRDKIYEYLQFSVQYGKELVDQAKCAMEYYSLEKKSSYLTMSSSYSRRIPLPNIKEIPEHYQKEPYCDQYVANVDGCFSKIQADNIASFEISPEENVTLGDKSYDSEMLRRIAIELLNTQPKSWKAHLIGSFYWRNIGGNALEALKCACRAVTFAPNDVKDIALLSFGTILFRAGCLDDADVILVGAMQMKPEVAENHFTLGAALAIKHDFNRSLAHFDEAEMLNPSLLPKTLPIRNFISCFENLSKKTTKMNSYVDFIKNEVQVFKTLKQEIRRKHEALMHQQVPLGARDLNEFANTDEMRKRGQYCSMRKLAASEEPVLFCDFFSEMQVKLESQDLDISTLERNLKATSEAVIKQVSKELGTKVTIYKIDHEKNDRLQKQNPIPSTRTKDRNARLPERNI